MATKTEDRKIYEPEYLEETPLPEAVIWENIVDAPQTLKDLSSVDGGRLDTVETEVATGFADIAIQGWMFDGAFSATDHDTVAWAAGTIRFKDGVSYSIAGGNTGDMAATTYIYFDLAVSTTAFQTTTTAANAVGVNKLLIAVAQNVSSGKDATFQAFGGKGGVGVLLTADNIAANSITANEIQTNTITTLNLTAGTISGMTITGGTFRTAASGERIEITTGVTNKINFYDDSTLYGQIEVDTDGSDGYLRFWAFDEGAGLEIDTGISASGFNATQIFSNGGSVFTNGNASNGYTGFIAKNGGFFYLHGGASDDEIVTDVPFGCDILFNDDGVFNIGDATNRLSTIYALTISGLSTLNVSGTGTFGTLNNGNVLPRIYHGYISGTTLSKTNSSFTISSGGTGRYIVTHNFNSLNYTVQATALRGTGSGAYSAKVSDLSLNSFEITIFDDTGAAQASDLMFTMSRN